MKTQLPDDQADLLNNIEEFNRSVGEKGWNLNNVIIENKDVSGIHIINSVWENVDVNDSKFILSHIENSTFNRVTFRDVDFSESIFSNCRFQDCDFLGAKFCEAKLLKCHINQSRLEGTDFNKSMSQHSEWRGVKATKLDCKYARLENVSFLGGEYKKAMFSESVLNDVTFLDSKLIQCGFIEAELNRCQFKIEGQVVNFMDSKCDRLTITGAPTINDLNLAGVKGREILVESLNNSKFFALDFAEIENFQLKNSKLSYATCVSASFINSNFHDTTFECIRFNKTRFQNVNFENITFIDELIFDDAIFENINFNNIRKAENYSGSFKNTIFEGKEPFKVR